MARRAASNPKNFVSNLIAIIVAIHFLHLHLLIGRGPTTFSTFIATHAFKIQPVGAMAPSLSSGRPKMSLSPVNNDVTKIPMNSSLSSSSSYIGEKDVESLKILLKEWVEHSHADYHSFTYQEATEIRSALLQWYSENRRKLPWRGDPPPFDGSTSGINNNGKNKKKSVKAGCDSDKKQKSITSFFSNTSSETATSKGKEEDMTEEDNVKMTEAIPVTGYGIWVSEIMLQQTRVEAVIPYWIKWMKSFPTIHDLAAATEDKVNSHWAGLGFYRRARLLHEGAKHVVNKMNGKLPTTKEELVKIQGIGPYTAAAISSIAFDRCVPVVDGNVCRVLSRLTGIANHIKNPVLKDKLGWKLAAQILEAGDGSSPGALNQALMELGATYCSPSGSGIDKRDPLREFYQSTKLGRAVLATIRQPEGEEKLRELLLSLDSQTGCCQLCDSSGLSSVLEVLHATINIDSTFDEAAKCGHNALPMDPPKSEKREEDLAVAVLSARKDGSSSEKGSVRYLMVKRPKAGLLAGQWEFPNVCIQIRNDKKNKNTKVASKPPTKAKRSQALTEYLLGDLLFEYADGKVLEALREFSRESRKESIDHIFSHVLHYMWIESGHLSIDLTQDSPLEWTSSSGKQVRWMNNADMKEVGITSGVKKILGAVQTSNKLTKTTSRKRKR
jgi:A/G-specific adenine glycosylase